MIALLDEDMCGKYIWSQVPSSHVSMILAMKERTIGGVYTKIDFRQWMLNSLKNESWTRMGMPLSASLHESLHNTCHSSHIVDLNELSKCIYYSEDRFKFSTLVKRDEDEKYLEMCVQECMNANLSFYLLVDQCTFCSNLQGSFPVRHSQQCTRTHPTCAHVMGQFARLAESVPGMRFAKVKLHGIYVDNKYGKEILGHVRTIFERSESVASLELANIHCTCSEDESMLQVLSKAKNVERLCFRQICLFHTEKVAIDFPLNNDSLPQYMRRGVQVVHWLGAYCMPLGWIEAVCKASKICNLRSLIICKNTLLPQELHNCAELLWRCPFLEELVFVDDRRGTKTSNLGVWILTAISNLANKEVAQRGMNSIYKYRQLKSITMDIGTPALQTLNSNGEALVFDYEDFPKSWQDTYPSELIDFQVQHELGVGGDVSCMVDSVMPALETLRIRCGDNLSTRTGLHLINNLCRHREKEGGEAVERRKCKNLVMYTQYGDRSTFARTAPLAIAVENSFEDASVLPLSKFPFF